MKYIQWLFYKLRCFKQYLKLIHLFHTTHNYNFKQIADELWNDQFSRKRKEYSMGIRTFASMSKHCSDLPMPIEWKKEKE